MWLFNAGKIVSFKKPKPAMGIFKSILVFILVWPIDAGRVADIATVLAGVPQSRA